MHDQKALRSTIKSLRPAFEERLAALVEAPSVSMDPSRRADIERCADIACEHLREAGATAEKVTTAGYPIVIGKMMRDPSFPTVTVYNHLDVQPADPAEWKTPPFKLTRQADRWRGRGTTDDKGPALTALYGARLAATDDVPLNIQFLWEMEEEIGSPNFETALREIVKQKGFTTDSVVVSDTIWIAAGRPAIAYGLRGLMSFTVRLRTGQKDVHSGTTGGAARNPLGELAGLVAECYDPRSGKVKIPGFYDDVRKLTPTERKGFARAGFSRLGFQGAHELTSVRFPEDLRLMEAIMAQPTFEVHGLSGGYAGPGVKTIVPHAGELKLSTRLVPDQDPAKIFRLVKRFIKERLPDAEVTHGSSLAPFISEVGGPYQAAAAEAMKESFGVEPALTREGGSIGAVLTMNELLRAPITFMGLSLPEHGYHAINENYDWGQASGGMEMFYRYFHKLGALRVPSVARRTRRGMIER